MRMKMYFHTKLNDMMNNAVKWDTTIINKIIKHVSKHPFEYWISYT
jgi:hypothetical protein